MLTIIFLVVHLHDISILKPVVSGELLRNYYLEVLLMSLSYKTYNYDFCFSILCGNMKLLSSSHVSISSTFVFQYFILMPSCVEGIYKLLYG
jgi:hypothetical protein